MKATVLLVFDDGTIHSFSIFTVGEIGVLISFRAGTSLLISNHSLRNGLYHNTMIYIIPGLKDVITIYIIFGISAAFRDPFSFT